jgi:predicted nucleotidyltransferase component of viral defense system
MTDAKHYTNAQNFRQALDERLKNMARQTNASINDLHRQVVFDRFLARLDPERFVLTGGYSLELRLPKSRSTTDIDLYIRDQQILAANEDEQRQAILYALRQQAENEIPDHFSFHVERILGKLHGPKDGGIRCLVIARIDNKDYHRFHVDVAVVPEEVLKPEYITPSDKLAFAGVESKPVATLQLEEIFANKIHAYSRSRLSENTRVEDIIDMALLIESGLDDKKTLYALGKVFAASAAHQTIPTTLKPPPTTWQKDFYELSQRRNLTLSLEESFQRAKDFYERLPTVPT